MRMKKYLITAAMAVAVSGALVSCHEDEITGSTVEQKIQAFENIFTQAFGKPAPNHTFGFGAPIVLEGEEAFTRSINVNGNLWKDCPEVGTKEEADVLAYLSTLQTKERNPVRLQNYFVTQIHKGEETYYNVGGGYVGVGSDKMNNLHIAMSDGLTINNGALSAEGPTAWDHINNFNAGTCDDWGAGDADGQGNTLVLNGGTFDFAYEGAEDSKYHNRWCSIDGANVPRTDGKGTNYAGYYYICFDFEQDAPTKTVFYIDFQWTHEADGGHMQTDNVSIEYKISGSYDRDHISDIVTAMGGKFTYEGQEYNLTADMIRWANIEGANQNVNPNSSYKDWIIRLVKAERDGDIPPVKILTESTTTDGYVARKIVTGEKVMKSGRIFCEDIVSADSKYALEDLDYNDVVYDAAIINKYRKLVTTYLDKDRNPIIENGAPKQIIKYDFDISGQANGYNSLYAIVRLLAAGGTMPIAINILPKQFNADVHNVLGQTSTTIMINTLDEGEREKVNMAGVASPVPAEDLKKETGEEREKFYNVNDLDNGIELYVEYGNIAAGIRSKYYDDETGDVVASAKYMVPLGTPWAKERVKITNAYPKFNEWIADESVKFWEHPALDENNSIDKSLFYDYDGKKVVGLDPDVYAEGKIIGTETETDLGEEANTSSSSTLDTTPATNTVMGTPVGTKIYDFTIQTVGPGYLYDGNQVTVISETTITAGSKIRIYGVSIEDWEVTVDNQTKSASNGGNYTTKGYIEFDVTSNIGTRFNISGKNFTITYVTVINSTPTTTTQDFWENTSKTSVANYNSYYRFALEGHDDNNECLATFSSDVWNRIKTSTFYLVVRGANPAIRVTNGWWDATWPQAEYNFTSGNDRLTNNGDGTWTLKIDLANSALVSTIDQKHLLFSGDGYTPVKLYFIK